MNSERSRSYHYNRRFKETHKIENPIDIAVELFLFLQLYYFLAIFDKRVLYPHFLGHLKAFPYCWGAFISLHGTKCAQFSLDEVYGIIFS